MTRDRSSAAVEDAAALRDAGDESIASFLRRRFGQEAVELIKRLWTEESVTVDNDVCTLSNVTLTCRPVQRPHPPIWVAATTQDTYAIVGRMGMPIFIAVRTTPISDLKRFIGGYHEDDEVGKKFADAFIEKQARGGDKEAQASLAVADKLIPHLDSGRRALTAPLSPEEQLLARRFFLLTSRPILFAAYKHPSRQANERLSAV